MVADLLQVDTSVTTVPTRARMGEFELMSYPSIYDPSSDLAGQFDVTAPPTTLGGRSRPCRVAAAGRHPAALTLEPGAGTPAQSLRAPPHC